MVVLLAILATYRLAYDATRMDGPFHLYLRMRGWFIGRYGEGHWLTDGVTCPICLSFWIALPMGLGASLVSPLPWLLAWLGIAGGALVIIKTTQQDPPRYHLVWVALACATYLLAAEFVGFLVGQR